ncbi:MAG: FKBP-type peptidyl-prolyl cis-trans isomerase [Bacteroidales bacterium]|nr:FKBP-type peptidyl-prolyl cis-trans isomerase [Bacteroidales bacterium]
MKIRHIATFLAGLALLTGCEKESLRTLFAGQETKIETLVSAQLTANEDYSVSYNDGSTRLTVVHGEGDGLSGDMLLSFYYAGYVLTGSTLPAASSLFATNSEDVATAARWNLSKAEEGEDAENEDVEEEEEEPDNRYEICTVKFSEANFVEGLAKGLEGVKGGEECWIFFSGRHGFGDKKFGTIPANSAIAYHIWVHSVQSDEL